MLKINTASINTASINTASINTASINTASIYLVYTFKEIKSWERAALFFLVRFLLYNSVFNSRQFKRFLAKSIFFLNKILDFFFLAK